eukprot:scaffold337_cov393-Prasinococcus_capsulatus_cf.AAC.2
MLGVPRALAEAAPRPGAVTDWARQRWRPRNQASPVLHCLTAAAKGTAGRRRDYGMVAAGFQQMHCPSRLSPKH